MRRATPLVFLVTLAMVFVTGPATAHEEAEVCQGRTIPLATDANGNPIEQLVEHHLYFHGETPSGNADAARGFADMASGNGGPKLTMDATAPAGAQDKVFVHNIGDGARWNLNYAMSPALAYWHYGLSAEERVVCAQATVYARTSSGTLNVQLWADKGLAETDPIVTSPASGGTANATAKYTVNFGELDFLTSLNLIVQLAGPAGTANAPVFYDSSASPAGLTYVTVEPI